MLNECIEMLNVKPDGIYVDCTAGGGGHSKEILKKLTTGKLVDIDKDEEALNHCRALFSNFSSHEICYCNCDFKQFDNALDELGIGQVDGIMADLGLSSYQIDTAQRGFSYLAEDAPLDMRMNQHQELSAEIVVNDYEQEKIAEILRVFGEESFAGLIAKNIVEQRKIQRITTCGQLVQIIDRSIPKKFQKVGSHNAKKTFQAIRIEVNGELDGLKEAFEKMIQRLKPGGRLVVLTFHSLEDRIAKQVFNFNATDCICDKSIPICVCNHKASIKLINKKPLIATEQEQRENSRSRSAKLRVVEKL